MRGLAAAAMVMLGIATPATADSLTYRNDRFGTRATFAAELFPMRDQPPANGDGMRFRDPDGGSLTIFGSLNAEDESPRAFMERSLTERRATYSRAGSDWVVLSGRERADGKEMIFYERYLFAKDKVIHAVRLSYPAMLAAKYDRMAGPIANTLSAQ